MPLDKHLEAFIIQTVHWLPEMDIIISILVIFGYNNIHYEVKEGCSLSQVSKNLGSAW